MKNLIFAFLLLTTFSVSFSATINKNLKIGSKGNDVKVLQTILFNEGYLPDESYITGSYGKLTAKAVSELQSDYGVKSVGYVGPSTLKVINVLGADLIKDNNVKTQNVDNVVTKTNTPVVNSNNIQNNTIQNQKTKENLNKTQVKNSSNIIKQNVKYDIKTIKSDNYKNIINNNLDVKTGKVKISFATSTNKVSKVIIRYKTKPTKENEDRVASLSVKKKKALNLVPVVSAEISDDDIHKLTDDTNILSIEKDEEIYIDSTSEYINTWGVSKIGTESVYSNGFSGRNVKVAVLDTGIDYNHPELSLNHAGGYNFVSDSLDTYDDNGHGTHVSGTIAALNNDSSVVGVSPEAKLYTLKILNSSGVGYTSNVIRALEWAVDNGMQVVNLSFGTKNYPGTALEDAIINAENKGLVVVASAGNNGTCAGTTTDIVNYPAKFESVLSVGAVDSNNSHGCFSATGNSLDISAPGVSVNSTKLGGSTGLRSGTSMASPHVSGVVALLIGAGVLDKNNNGRINDEVKDIIKGAAYDLGSSGLDDIYGYGLIRADNAISYLQSIKATTTPVATTTQQAATTTETNNITQSTTTVATTTQPMNATTTQTVATSTPSVNQPTSTTTNNTNNTSSTTTITQPQTPTTNTASTTTIITQPQTSTTTVVSAPVPVINTQPSTTTQTVKEPVPVPINNQPQVTTPIIPPVISNPVSTVIPTPTNNTTSGSPNTIVTNPVLQTPTEKHPVYRTLPDQASDRAKLEQEINRSKKEAEEKFKQEIEKIRESLKREKENQREEAKKEIERFKNNLKKEINNRR